MRPVKNIIFDLGGVIINLDILATIKAFEALGAGNFSSVYTQAAQNKIFDAYDKGLVTSAEFRAELNRLTGLQLSEADFNSAWNAMLLDFPAHRLQLLKALKTKYHIFLLSNTNVEHIRTFEQTLLKDHGYSSLDGFFEKAYYSCKLGMRKPDREIFDKVLLENALDPAETIFIDDSAQHIAGAEKAGIKSYLLPKNEEAGDLLKELGLI